MTLSYLPSLIKYFKEYGDKINDHKNFPIGWVNSINKLNDEDLLFTFGINIELEDTERYKIFNVSRMFELLLGFYTDSIIEFDLYIDNDFQNHYKLEPKKLTQLEKQNGEKYIIPTINYSKKHLHIRNLKTDLYAIRLITLGVALNTNDREETINSKVYELNF